MFLFAALGALSLGACAGTSYLKKDVTLARAGDKSFIAECKPVGVGGRNLLHCWVSDVVDQDEESVTAVPAANQTFAVGLEDSAQSLEAKTDGMGEFEVDVLAKLDPEPFFNSDKEDLCVKVSGACIARASRALFGKAAKARILAKVDSAIQSGSKQCLDWIDTHPELFAELRKSNSHEKLVTCAADELMRLVLSTMGQDGVADAEKHIARLAELRPESNRLAQMRAFIAPMKLHAKEAAAKDLSVRASKLIGDGDAEGAMKLAQDCIDLKPSIATRCVELRERAESMKNLKLAFSLEKQAREAIKARKPQAALQAAAQCYEYDRTNKNCKKLAIGANVALRALKKKKANKLASLAKKALRKNEQYRAQEHIAACLGMSPYHAGCLALKKAYDRKYNIQAASKEVWGGVSFGMSPAEVVKGTKVGKLFMADGKSTYRSGDEVPAKISKLVACASRTGSGIQRPMSCVSYFFKNGGLVKIDVGYESYGKGRVAKREIASLRTRYGKPQKTQSEDFTPIEYRPTTYLVVTWIDPAATIELVCQEEEFLQTWSVRFISSEAE